MSLFPTMDSLDAVLNLGLAQFPENTHHSLKGLLMTYQNTLINQLEKHVNPIH